MGISKISEKIYSIEEYLQLEIENHCKYEYCDGVLYDMAGGTISHNLISSNALVAIKNALKSKSCFVFGSDQKIYIEELNNFVYPDLSVVCGEIESSSSDKNAVVNPVLIIEVLSDTTAAYDRGGKFHKYCTLPSFKEYLLVDQNKPIVDSLYREEKGYWKMRTLIGLDKDISISSLGCTITMKELYENINDLQSPQFNLDF